MICPGSSPRELFVLTKPERYKKKKNLGKSTELMSVINVGNAEKDLKVSLERDISGQVKQSGYEGADGSD